MIFGVVCYNALPKSITNPNRNYIGAIWYLLVGSSEYEALESKTKATNYSGVDAVEPKKKNTCSVEGHMHIHIVYINIYIYVLAII